MLPTTILFPPRPKLSEREFNRISHFITEHYGIKLPITKLILVEGRLTKRLVQLNMATFKAYVDFIFADAGREELDNLINHLSTNKTDFFRENAHFKFLEKHIATNKIATNVNIWSSACSSGEEPYTISMVLEEMKNNGSFPGSYSLLGTDISTTILAKATRGEYAEKAVENLPIGYLKKYFSCVNGIATVSPALRRSLTLQKFNLVDPYQYQLVPSKFDFIFCRNVLIYFDQDTQRRVVGNLIGKLVPGGFLFLGHSETLLAKNFPVVQIQPTIYQKIYA
jgi:chemotaxis protein methyltransferase CheR